MESVDDEAAAAAEAARELIDDLEAELLKVGIPLETLETLRFAYATQDKLDARQKVERKAAEQRRAYGEARDRYEVREKLWADFNEACRYLRRSKMSEASKSAAINKYGLQNYFRIPWA
jgi:hypothetical protein